MKRRILHVLLAASLVVPSLPLTGCSLLGEKTAAEPFTTDYELTDAGLAFFVDNDSFETAAFSNPFYAGSRQLPGQNTGDFDVARAEQVRKIVADGDTLVQQASEADKAMIQLRSDLVTYISSIYREDPALTEFAGEALPEMASLASQEMLAKAAYKASVQTSGQGAKAYADSMNDFMRVSQAMQYASLMLEDLEVMSGICAMAVDTLATHRSEKVKSATAAFDATAGKDIDAAIEALRPVAATLVVLDERMNLLASADYYLAGSALTWMEQEQAKLDPVMAGLEVREPLSAQNVADMKGSYEALKQWNAALRDQYASMDTSGLVSMAELGVLPKALPGEGVAYAQVAGESVPLQYDAATAAANRDPAPPEGLLSTTWSGIKSVFGKAKTGLGVTVDTLGAGVHNITRAGYGIYYGEKPGSVWSDMKKRSQQVVDNYNNGVSGGDTFTEAGKMLEGVETGAGEQAGGAAEWATSQVFGKGKISGATGWAVGGLVKLTTGMFTGFAKGTYKIANTKSSTADVAMGFVDVGLSLIGGSKVLIKGSQIPGLLKGGWKGVTNLGKMFANLGEGATNKEIQAMLKEQMKNLLKNNKLTQEAAKKLMRDSINYEIRDAVDQVLKANRAALMKELRQILTSGAGGFATNFAGTIKDSLTKRFVKSFEMTFKGLLEAGTAVIGETPGKYLDNLIGRTLNGPLKDMIAEIMAIPPDAREMNGTWTGSWTILKVIIPQGSEDKAKEGNCAAIFKQLEGKSQAMTLKVNATGGTATMSGGGKNIPGSCRYSDGSITMSFASEGSRITFTGTAKLDKAKGMTMGGTFVLPYQGSGIKMTGKWNAVKTK